MSFILFAILPNIGDSRICWASDYENLMALLWNANVMLNVNAWSSHRNFKNLEMEQTVDTT